MSKRLYRSVKDRKIAGVAGGLAEYLGVDPSLIRILWVIFTLFGGSGIVVYIVGAIIIPENPEELMPKFQSPSETAPGAGNITEPVSGDFPAGSVFGDASEETPRREPVPPAPGDRTREAMLGLGLLGIGGYFLLRELFPFWFAWIPLWPLVLILLGVVLLMGGVRRGSR